TKLAHALTALLVNAYRRGGGELPEMITARVERLFDSDADDAAARHAEIADGMTDLSRLLGERARAGGVRLSTLPALRRPLAAGARVRSRWPGLGGARPGRPRLPPPPPASRSRRSSAASSAGAP